MTKYRAQITIEFETGENIPNVSMSGTVDDVGRVFNSLPDLTDVEEKSAKATLHIGRAEAAA